MSDGSSMDGQEFSCSVALPNAPARAAG